MGRRMGKCIIIGAGVCDTQLLERRLAVKQEDLCIAADGGLAYLTRIGRTPDLVLGDMDSLQTQALADFLQVKRLPVEKDDTDMLAAIKEGLAAGYEQFDHTLANIQCLLNLMNRGARGTIVGDDVTLMLIKDTKMCFPADFSQRGRRISVFAYGGDAYGVSERGLKYLLDEVTVKQEFPIGVSNEFIGEPAEVEVQRGMLLLCVEEY